MTLPRQINDREHDKFLWDTELGTVVKTITKFTDGVTIGDVNIKAPTGPFLVSVASVGTTATNPIPTPLTARVSLSIRNKSETETIYFGHDNTVTPDDTATGGWEIGPGEDFNIDLDDTNDFYLIAAVPNVPVKFFQIAST